VDVANPISCLAPSTHGPVLAVLAGATEPLTGRKIAELTRPRVSASQVATTLRDLTEQGLVASTPAGRSKLYVLNRSHVAAPVVAAAVRLRQELWDRIVAHVRGWQHPAVGVVVFGSTARGDGDRRSDIDLLVVRPDVVEDERWQQDLADLAEAVLTWSGNPCEILDRSAGDLAQMAAARERLLTEIRRDGRVLLGSRSLVPPPAVGA